MLTDRCAEKILKNPRFSRHVNAIKEPLSLYNFLLLAMAVLETEPVVFAAADQLLSNHTFSPAVVPKQLTYEGPPMLTTDANEGM